MRKKGARTMDLPREQRTDWCAAAAGRDARARTWDLGLARGGGATAVGSGVMLGYGCAAR